MTETQSGGNPAPKPPSATPTTESLDLTKWKGSASKAEPTTAPQRPRDPKVEWGALAGIAGLAIVRIGVGITSKTDPATKMTTDFPWVGATVRLPPTTDFPNGKKVFCLTAVGDNGTVAGGDLMRGLRAGVFDVCDEAHPVAVHVRTAMNPDYPHGRPMAFLTLG